MLNYLFHPEAYQEMLGEKSYIKDDDPAQATLFGIAFDEALQWARSEPLIARCFEKEYRKIKVGKFRVDIVFRIKGDEIQILAVAHHSRRPGYWKERARNWEQ